MLSVLGLPFTDWIVTFCQNGSKVASFRTPFRAGSFLSILDDHGIVTCQNNNLEKLKKVLAKMLLKSYTNVVASSGGHRISL